MSLSALTPGNVFVRCSIWSRSGPSAMGVTIEKGRSGCRFSGSRVRLLAGLGVFFEDGANVDTLALVAFDILFGDQGLRCRDDAWEGFLCNDAERRLQRDFARKHRETVDRPGQLAG